MSKKLKLAFLAGFLALISISSPVLAASDYNSSVFTGAGSSGYNAGNAIH